MKTVVTALCAALAIYTTAAKRYLTFDECPYGVTTDDGYSQRCITPEESQLWSDAMRESDKREWRGEGGRLVVLYGGSSCGIGGDVSMYPGAVHRGGNCYWGTEYPSGREIVTCTERIYYEDGHVQVIDSSAEAQRLADQRYTVRAMHKERE